MYTVLNFSFFILQAETCQCSGWKGKQEKVSMSSICSKSGCNHALCKFPYMLYLFNIDI